jgi:DNA-binding CsgD family transcriptional regulator
LVPSTVVSASANAHVLLTSRETEVLALLAEGCQTKRLLAILAFPSIQPSFTYVL